MESVHFPLWTYNPTTGKVKLDSADKSDTVSFAANAVSKELGENRFKQLVKKIGQEKAMEMLKGVVVLEWAFAPFSATLLRQAHKERGTSAAHLSQSARPPDSNRPWP